EGWAARHGGSACVDEISGCGTADSVTCVTYSPSLLEIINVTNRASNNFYAETLLKMTGLKLGGDGTYKSALKLVKEYISGKGCHTWGFSQDDGSGLSRQNYVSPRFFCRFYGTMMKSGNFDLFFSTLPIPGQDGTMKNVLAAEPWSVRSRIHAKSGSLSNVRCYTGFVKCADGTLLRFAIMVNNHPGTSRTVQPKIEAFLKELSLYASQQGANATN
ncbi:MAG: D-alanyl-D-alanine carboxypeptidase, partial [Bacteroidales bacterium]|nr:D-alanyl-D-alanine carboxypeptidase [Bacteroidales bacterium]